MAGLLTTHETWRDGTSGGSVSALELAVGRDLVAGACA